MNVYESLVRGLEDAGVRTAFGGNGENIASLAIALKHSSIRPIMTRHEQAASFMACGYAMFSDRLGVCFATVGPGAFNLLTGLGVAMSDSYPVLAITGFVRREWCGHGAVNDTSGLNGTPDSRAIFAATTKGSFFVEHADGVCDVVEEAVNLAHAGRPGPVHIHVPQDLTDRGIEVRNHRRIRVVVDEVRPDPDGVEEIAELLVTSLRDGRRVVVLAGYGAVRAHAEEALRAFVERFGTPLLTTLDGKGLLPESHPLTAGVFHECGHASAWAAFREADVVLAVGNSLVQHQTFGLRKDLFDGKELVQVNISATEIGRHYPVRHALVADGRLALEALHAAMDDRVERVTPPHVENPDHEGRRHLPRPRAIHPGSLAQAIGRRLPPRAILLADAGTHLAWLGHDVELEEGQSFRKCGAFGPMAAHTNGAIGVKLANPDRTVVVGCGDGCYSMAGFELMTAVQNDVAVIWVIFNDGEYKLVKTYQVAEYLESALVEFDNPDFAAYARACGAEGHRVESLGDFEDAFEAALRSGRPTVIDAKISRWAIPHYSTSPAGVLPGAMEHLEERLRHH